MPVRPMRMRHYNGTATTTPAKVSLGRQGQYIRITNLDATNALKVSFNGGRTFFFILAGDPPLEVPALFHFFWVQSSAATVDYSALVGEG